MKYYSFCLSALILSICIGCGDSNKGSVVGTITLDGVPLSDATVTFTPESSDGVLAIGRTDANGNYSLSAPDKAKVSSGAFHGEYKVTVSKIERIPDPDQQAFDEGKIDYDTLQSRLNKKGGSQEKTVPLVPKQYSNTDQTELKASVEAKKQNRFDFDLKK